MSGTKASDTPLPNAPPPPTVPSPSAASGSSVGPGGSGSASNSNQVFPTTDEADMLERTMAVKRYRYLASILSGARRVAMPSITARILRSDGSPFPTVSNAKTGIQYTIAEPGATYQVELTVDDSKLQTRLSEWNRLHVVFDIDGISAAVMRVETSGRHVRHRMLMF